MGKIRMTINTSFGNVNIEGETFDDIKKILSSLGLSENEIKNVLQSVESQLKKPSEIPSAPTPAPARPELEGVVEYASDGSPNITVPPEKLTAREVIGILLYAKEPALTTMKEIGDLVARNWKSVSIQYVSANLSQMRGLIIREGKRGSYSYRLSGAGKSWIESELLPKLKSKEVKE